MKWNDDWRIELEATNEECYIRLCECRNNKKDILIISKLMYKYNKQYEKEDSFIRTLEWIGDWNNQYNITDLTTDEYFEMLGKI